MHVCLELTSYEKDLTVKGDYMIFEWGVNETALLSHGL